MLLQIDLDDLEQDENIAPSHDKSSNGEGQLEGPVLLTRGLKHSLGSSKCTVSLRSSVLSMYYA